MAAQQPGLTPMDLGRYYMRRMAMRVDAEHFQELCRTVAYAIDPAQTAYNLAVHYGVIDLPTPEELWHVGTLPDEA
jgi:hypothetical protein